MSDPNNSPSAPPTHPVATGITWMTIVGAVFASVLLVFFLVLGGYAAVNPTVQFNCASFSFLAVAFAIGSAAAGAFLGGGAAIEGRLGSMAADHPVRFSLVGGVAVLIICLLAFFVLKPSDCEADETVSFEQIPARYDWKVDPDFWMRNEPAADGSDITYEVMVRNSNARGSVFIKSGADTICRFGIVFQRDELENHQSYQEVIMRPLGEIRLTYQDNASRTERVSVDDCFRYRGRTVEGEIIVALGSRKAYLNMPEPSEQPTQSEFEDAALIQPSNLAEASNSRTPWSLFIQPAFAQGSSNLPAYPTLREQLSQGKDHQVAIARQHLSDHFDFYKVEILSDLDNENNDSNANLMASLVSALIAGIELEQPDLVPQSGRQLDQEIHIVNGRVARLLSLVEHDDPSVRQQARRLFQRYPMDEFEGFFRAALSDNFCGDELYRRRLYASVFYFYNRLIQQRLNDDLTLVEIDAWRDLSELIKDKFSNCLDPPEKYDAALMDYGLSTVTRWSGRQDLSSAFGEDFIDFISEDPSSYYRQSHIDKIEDLLSFSDSSGN